MDSPLIINVALTGMVPRRKDNSNVPIIADEIAADVKRCFEVGARIFHIHARDESEIPTYRKEVFSEIIQKVRKSVPKAIICVTTSGRFYTSFDARSDVLNLDGDVKPDLASLTLGSLNFPKQVSMNSPEMIEDLASCMTERDIIPELEIFDFGMLDYANHLIQRGTLKPPFIFNLMLGSLGTLSATPLNLALLVERLPKDAIWSAAGIGKFQFPMNRLGIAMGGNVRTGLEDNLYMNSEKRLATNEQLVSRVVKCAIAMERPIATPEQVRHLLK